MEVALVFGSVGDIIALCQLAFQFGKALHHAAAASCEYQVLRDDLDSFVRVLMQVVATYEQYENSALLNGIDKVAQDVVNQCGDSIQQELRRLEARYGDCLQSNGSPNRVKRAFKKLEFSLREKESIYNLRQKLQTDTERLSLLTSLAAQRSVRVDNATLRARIEEVHSLVSRLQRGQEDMMDLLRKQEATAQRQTCALAAISNQINAQAQSCGTLVEYARTSVAALAELKKMITVVSRSVVQLQFQASDARFFQGPDPTRGLPVLFEDALGFVLEIPLDWVEDWEDFHVLLEHRFKKRKGQRMVRGRQYALEEHHTGQLLDQQRPWAMTIRRGMKIDMSMVFIDHPETTCLDRRCPRCHTLTGTCAGKTVQCNNCLMFFRKLLSLTNRCSDRPVEARLDLAGNRAYPVTPPEEISNTTGVQPNGDKQSPDSPSDFQRVQMLGSAFFPAPDARGQDIPLEATWTRIKRSLVSAEALAEMGIRYEARPHHIDILGALGKHDLARIAHKSDIVRRSRQYSPRFPATTWSDSLHVGLEARFLMSHVTYVTTEDIIRTDKAEQDGLYLSHLSPSSSEKQVFGGKEAGRQ